MILSVFVMFKVSSPRPGVGDASKVLEDLQHDIEVIGDIVGKVSSLRRKYRVCIVCCQSKYFFSEFFNNNFKLS